MATLKPGEWTEITVDGEEAGRLDAYLPKAFPEITRSRAQKLIDEGHVRKNGAAAKANNRLVAGDRVEIFLPAPKSLELKAEAIPLKILFEDKHLAVIDKPAGLVVHPAVGHEDGTLVNALLHHFDDLSSGGGIGGELRPGIVHRIDRNTSGILLVTKTDLAHLHLSKQFKEHTITRKYQGLAWGPLPEKGEWNQPIGRDPKERKRMAIVPGGRDAITRFRRLASFAGPICHFEAELFTGRTHQIRVHFSAHGFPLAGDAVYTGATRGARRAKEIGMQALLKRCPEAHAALGTLLESGRQFLHAAHLGFVHPVTEEILRFDSELPADLSAVMLSLAPCKNP